MDIEKGKETTFEERMKADETQADLLRLSLFDSNYSISDNVKGLTKFESEYLLGLKTQDGTYYSDWNRFSGTDQVRSETNKALNRGVDDNTLMYNNLTNLYNTFDKYSGGLINPTSTISNAFDLNVKYNKYISATGTQDRGCDNAGCGNYGAGRGNRIHTGLDLKTNENDIVFSPQKGTISYIRNVYKTNNGTLQGITIDSNDGTSKIYYVKPKTYLKVGTEVNQGDIIGNGQDLSKGSPIRHGGKNSTPNHIHQEIRIMNKPANPSNYIYNKK